MFKYRHRKSRPKWGLASSSIQKQINDLGRYELDDRELTSGSPIEVWRDYDASEGYFVRTRIEHNGTDYYAVALGAGVSLDGVRVRLKA